MAAHEPGSTYREKAERLHPPLRLHRREHCHGPSGRVGLRQKHDPALHRGHREARQGPHRAGRAGAVRQRAAHRPAAPAAGRGPALPELRPLPEYDRGAEHPLRPESRKGQSRPQGPLRRDAAGLAAGRTGQPPPGRAFRRTAAAHRAGPYPCGQAEDLDAGRAVQCAGQLPPRGGGGRSGQPAGGFRRHGPACHPQPGRGLPPVPGHDRHGRRAGAPHRHHERGLCRPGQHRCGPADRLQEHPALHPGGRPQRPPRRL